MRYLDRRAFLKMTSAGWAGASLMSVGRLVAAEEGKRKFTIAFVGGSIGVKADQRESIAYAHRFGFESVAPVPQFLAGLSAGQLDDLLGELKSKGLVWAAASLPVNFRGEEEKFQRDLAELPRLAEAIQRAGATRVGTWLSPSHNSLTYRDNFRQHAARLRSVAKVLDDSGLRFGLEYVGPKTSWTRGKYPFVHNMSQTRELIAEIGQDNVGLVLDSWHWYTAGETVDDILRLTNDDVVAGDLNDAPAGIARDEQIDSRRELPCATGVIDLKGFLSALVAIGFDGPIRAEPFNQKLREMPDEEAVAATAAAMKKAFALVE